MKNKSALALKIIIGLMLLFLVLFISSSLFASQASYSNEITINKPITEVFNKLSDSNFMKEWNPVAQTVTVEKTTANKVGSIYLIKAKQKGKEFQVKQTITKYEPATSFSDELDVENMMVYSDYLLESTGNSTKLTKHTVTKGKSHFIRWVSKIYKSKFQDAEQQSLALFKKAVEQ